MTTRKEVISAIRVRYQGASKADKANILNEFSELTSYHRKHAIRVLNKAESGAVIPPQKSGLQR
jgi:hypothetical protein